MTSNSNHTLIKSMNITNFRSFKDVPIEIGEHLTMISGLNGTGKSTILGMLAQICSFSKSYTPSGDQSIPIETDLSMYKTIQGTAFESDFSDHFRISKIFDNPNKVKYQVSFDISDYLEKLNFSANLSSTKRGDDLRLVLRRGNSLGQSSRNITYPTIFLSLRRLTPLVNRKIQLKELNLTTAEKKKFIDYSNQIFTPVDTRNNISSNLPDSDISSAAITNNKFDITSASTGEDNIGQLILALLSFERLKKNWNDYAGGLLLIDELDASMFPRAQEELLTLLNRFSSKNNVQVIFTTHSPILIDCTSQLMEQSTKNNSTKNNIHTNFISNATGNITNEIDLPAVDVNLKLLLKLKSNLSRKIPLYAEDDEAFLFTKMLLKQSLLTSVKREGRLTIGGDNILNLQKIGIREFTENALVILDGDKKGQKKCKNTLFLPSPTPPDQLMFRLLNESDPGDNYWSTLSSKFDGADKQWFLNLPETKIINKYCKFNSSSNKYTFTTKDHDLVIRELFKAWYKIFEQYMKNKRTNPIYTIWIPANTEAAEKFQMDFNNSLLFVQSNNK